MDNLNPVFRCLLVVEESISRGESVRDGLAEWLRGETGRADGTLVESELRRGFRHEVLDFLRDHELVAAESSQIESRTFKARSVHRQSLFLIFQAGMAGQPILPSLKDLRLEFEAQLELDMKAHIDSLPLRMLAPLLLCMFPAFLILLLGPITRNFLEALK